MKKALMSELVVKFPGRPVGTSLVMPRNGPPNCDKGPTIERGTHQGTQDLFDPVADQRKPREQPPQKSI